MAIYSGSALAQQATNFNARLRESSILGRSEYEAGYRRGSQVCRDFGWKAAQEDLDDLWDAGNRTRAYLRGFEAAIDEATTEE